MVKPSPLENAQSSGYGAAPLRFITSDDHVPERGPGQLGQTTFRYDRGYAILRSIPSDMGMLILTSSRKFILVFATPLRQRDILSDGGISPHSPKLQSRRCCNGHDRPVIGDAVAF